MGSVPGRSSRPRADRIPLRLTQSPDDELQPRVSPDGRRIAFTSNRNSDDGDFDIWMMRLFDSDGTGIEWRPGAGGASGSTGRL